MRTSCVHSAAFVAVALVSFSAVNAFAAVPVYNISGPLGLFDAEHTDTSGVSGQVGLHDSSVRQINDAGMTIGRSVRFVGVSAQLYDDGDAGRSAWINNGVTTTRLGFLDARHTQTGGIQNSRADTLTQAGNVFGASTAYDGISEQGETPWYYDGTLGTTTALGYTDPEHTDAGGVQSSELWESHAAGYGLGISNRYDGSGNYNGQSAWLYDGTTTTALGFTDAAHTASPSGLRSTSPLSVNSSGQVIGTSSRYNGNSYAGQSAWFYDGATTTRLGFTGGIFTNAVDGSEESRAQAINDAGQVVGISDRYHATNDSRTGVIAWIQGIGDATPTMIGLYDAAHTSTNGVQESYVERINQAGQAEGSSYQFSGTNVIGNTSWFYDGTTTTAIGLTGVGFVDSNGGTFASGRAISETGLVAGVSTIFDGIGDFIGESGWYFDGTITHDIGYVDASLTNPDGGFEQNIDVLTDTGFVAGSTSGNNNRVAWVYDPNTGISNPLTVPVGPLGPNEKLIINVEILNDTGEVLGDYDIYDIVTDTFITQGTFYWSLGSGGILLDGQIAGGIAAAGWQNMQSLDDETNALNQVLGGGLDNGAPGMSRAGYVLTPVPEPVSLALMCLGGLALLRRRA